MKFQFKKVRNLNNNRSQISLREVCKLEPILVKLEHENAGRRGISYMQISDWRA